MDPDAYSGLHDHKTFRLATLSRGIDVLLADWD